jgi:uncharacterized membrane protein YphA (DoxX/SURF4 family)
MTRDKGRNLARGSGAKATGGLRAPGGAARLRRAAAEPGTAEQARGEPGRSADRPRATVDLVGDLAADWAPTVARIMLGLVLLWFGYHELILPGEWTGYVPVVSTSSSVAIILVLAHGWALLVLAAALLAGIAPRAAAAIASVLLLEIVISLATTGLSDTTLRDVGVLGLAVCLTGCKNQRLVLRG